MSLLLNMRFIGAVLLITGTTTGAGMLALPVITSFGGFLPSICVFALCWILMLLSAFFFLDVNLAMPGESNLISMAGRTLGKFGKGISWILYLLLLYSLLAAYISASAPHFHQAIYALSGVSPPDWLSRFCLPVAFGGFLYLGTRGIDFINRILMLGFGISYVFLVAFAPSNITPSFLLHVDFSASLISVPVVLTAFGYHIIIPSLTTYLNHDARLLRLAIIWGSVIPIIIYLFWQVIVLGTVPQELLSKAWLSGMAATEPLALALRNPFIAKAALFFSFFAIVTSFLGVSLSLSDFLTDGLKIKKTWEGRLVAFCLTFVPPIIFVFTYGRGFYLALQYAGEIVAVLLGILPAIMAYRLKDDKFYGSTLGKSVVMTVAFLFFCIVMLDVLEKQGALHKLISSYLSM
jgi:tyrosine-specific transport protein